MPKSIATRKDATRTSPPRRQGKQGGGVGGTRPWTVLAWIAGDNDLEQFALQDLEEMKQAASTDAVNIVAQVDRMSDDRTRRYYLRRDTALADDVVAQLGETNTGDPAVAVDFFAWGMRRYPSERVLAVIWNHGSGIDETDVYARAATAGVSIARRAARSRRSVIPRANVRTMLARGYRRALFSTTVDQAMRDRGIAYDDTSRDFLDNAELKRVLFEVTRTAGRRIDLLGLDACLMNMLEIACQLHPTVDFIAGSEQVEPGDGWPYERVLGELAARPAMTARELGRVIVDEYVASYEGASVTQSLLDVARADACAAAVDALAGALLAALRKPSEYQAASKAMAASLRFEIDAFADLASFCTEVAARTRDAAVKRAAGAVIGTISGPGGLVASEAHRGEAMASARGVSIYAPRSTPAKAYARLEFARRTRWDEFLAAMNRG
jgi:hypothetical protein